MCVECIGSYVCVLSVSWIIYMCVESVLDHIHVC